MNRWMTTVLATILTTGAAWVTSSMVARADEPAAKDVPFKETVQQHDQRMQWWRDARFGMFIHWGIYAVPAGVYKGKQIGHGGEWIMTTAHIPVKEYEQFAKQFNPVKFDAAKWVSIAKDAGMKYLVITSKHHDGFTMFDDEGNDYTVAHATPWGKDPLAMLSEECRKQGIHFCAYYSIMDWHHPSQFPAKVANGVPTYNPTQMHPGKKQEYVRYMEHQLTELVTKYHAEVLWFDGEWPKWWTEQDGQHLYDFLMNLNPKLIINNRIGKGRKGMEGMNKAGGHFAGDFGTPEQRIPASGLPGVDWESCMTMNGTWGYKKNDHNWKSSQTLIRNIIDIASKGGNYLLNVGPTAEGEIPAPSVQRLAEIGKWMKVNGEAIYGTRATPFAKPFEWGRATRKNDRLYLEVFDWPKDGKLTIPALANPIGEAYLLDGHAAVKVHAETTGWTITLPTAAPDPVASVVVIETKGEPRVASAQQSVTPQPDGSFTLPAALAVTHGKSIRYEPNPEKNVVGYWTNAADWVQWNLDAARAGRYDVLLTQGCGTGSGGSQTQVSLGDSSLNFTVQETGGFQKFIDRNVGTLTLASTGSAQLTVKAITKPGLAVMDIRQIRLVPTM